MRASTRPWATVEWQSPQWNCAPRSPGSNGQGCLHFGLLSHSLGRVFPRPLCWISTQRTTTIPSFWVHQDLHLRGRDGDPINGTPAYPVPSTESVSRATSQPRCLPAFPLPKVGRQFDEPRPPYRRQHFPLYRLKRRDFCIGVDDRIVFASPRKRKFADPMVPVSNLAHRHDVAECGAGPGLLSHAFRVGGHRCCVSNVRHSVSDDKRRRTQRLHLLGRYLKGVVAEQVR